MTIEQPHCAPAPSMSELIADTQRDRPAERSSVERLKYYCINLRRAELAEFARSEFAMSR